MKILILIILFLLGGVFYSLKDSNLYWMPSNLRVLITSTKYQKGDCLRSERLFGVNPKRVIGKKFKKRKSYYLLRDMDRHEHDQLISMSEIDRYGQKTNCR